MAKLIFTLALLSVIISANGFFDPRKMFNLKSDLWDSEKRTSSFENENDSVVEGTITQRVDNFDPTNGQTFEQVRKNTLSNNSFLYKYLKNSYSTM